MTLLVWPPQPDKDEMALILAALAIVISLASAHYSRILARNDTARMQRAAPIFEFQTAASQDFPPWQTVHLRIRNFERVGMRLTDVHATRPGITFAPAPDFTNDQPDPRTAPIRLLLTGSYVGAVHDAKHPVLRSGPDQTIVFLAHGVRSSKDLMVAWYWADQVR